MLLSTAIRKGSKGHKQITCSYGNTKGEVCALGAASIVICGNAVPGHELWEAFPELTWQLEVEKGFQESLEEIIVFQNDDLGWSFDEISDWLEYYGY